MTEWLPVSSSAHVMLLRAEQDKALDVFLHAGTLAATLTTRPGLPPPALALAATGPPALVGYALEHWIEQRLASRRALACGLLAGSAPLLAADRLRMQPRGEKGQAPFATSLRAQSSGEEGQAPPARWLRMQPLADGLALGVAQALALWPGVSRTGATLAAARLRGHAPDAAARLALQSGIGVVVGATALKATRVRRPTRAHIAGAFAAFAAGCAAAPLRRALEGPLWPFAGYRAALAVALLWQDQRR